jgi:hypothetical protein
LLTGFQNHPQATIATSLLGISGWTESSRQTSSPVGRVTLPQNAMTFVFIFVLVVVGNLSMFLFTEIGTRRLHQPPVSTYYIGINIARALKASRVRCFQYTSTLYIYMRIEIAKKTLQKDTTEKADGRADGSAKYNYRYVATGYGT